MKLQDLKHIDKRMAPIMLGWMINSLGFGAIVPFMTVYFHTERGLAMRYISLFFLAAAVLRTLSQSIGGTVSDVIGRRGLMIWSQFSRSIIFLLSGIAIRYEMNIWIIAAILISQYLLSSFFQPIASAMIADIMPPQKRASGYALMRMAGNVGWGIGPAIGGFLFDISYESLFFFTAVIFLISGIYTVFSIKETVIPIKREKQVKSNGMNIKSMVKAFRRDRVFLFFCIIALLLFLTWGQFVSTLSVFMKRDIGLSSPQIGWVYTFNAMLVIIFQVLVTHWTRRRNHFLLMIVGSLLFAFSYAVMGWVSGFAMMMIMMIFITFGEMFAGPSGNAIASNMARPGQFGRYQGIYSSISTLGWSLGPAIGGVMMDLIPDMHMFWLSMSSFGFISVFGFLILYFKTKGKPAV